MNYLAHFYLADPDEPLMIGNYIGDGVKGSDLERYPENIQRGIKFHRFIDTYTDTHPIVREAKALLRPNQGRYTPVVVDVMFDHILAKNWQDFHPMDLEDFAEMCYNLVEENARVLPERSARFFSYMRSSNLLVNYRHKAGIDKVFKGMDSRTRFESNMVETFGAFQKVETDFSGLFQSFFPDLVNASSQWKSEH